MKVGKLLDDMIKTRPSSLMPKDTILLMSKENYKKLCKELKRNVRTYKKFKVKT